MTDRVMIEVTPEVADTLRKMSESLGCDKDVVRCDVCGNPVWADDTNLAPWGSPSYGCLRAATGMIEDQPRWCIERQAFMETVDKILGAK